eukprot:291965-Pleurochrysis_carterae.AAC.1
MPTPWTICPAPFRSSDEIAHAVDMPRKCARSASGAPSPRRPVRSLAPPSHALLREDALGEASAASDNSSHSSSLCKPSGTLSRVTSRRMLRAKAMRPESAGTPPPPPSPCTPPLPGRALSPLLACAPAPSRAHATASLARSKMMRRHGQSVTVSR